MPVTAFSTSDDAIVRKSHCLEVVATAEDKIDELYEISQCIKWIQDGNYQNIALQFPDNLLVDAPSIAHKLQIKIPHTTIFILGDTSYGSCCVDEVGAEHYKADSIIHFGHACLSPTARLPVLYVFVMLPLDVDSCVDQLIHLCPQQKMNAVLVYDTSFLHIIDELYDRLKHHLKNLLLSELRIPRKVATELSSQKEPELDTCTEVSKSLISKCGRIICLPEGHTIEDYSFIFIGDTSGPPLINMMMTFNKCPFYSYNSLTSLCVRESVNINRTLMKRFYFTECVKDANIIGIVAGTLGVARYREMIDHLKNLIKLSGKKCYTFVVGKLNPAKLANFAEIDLYVLVSCPESSLLEQSEFYRPVVSPYEVELALNKAHDWTGEYNFDFRELLPGGSMHYPVPEVSIHEQVVDVSLINNKVRVLGPKVLSDRPETGGKEVILRSDKMALSAVAVNAGEFLASRSFQGLERKLGETPVVKASEGITGIAAIYQHEPSS